MKQLFGILFLFLCNILQAQNVGIGTTTPTEKLHVVGNIKNDTIKPNAIKLLPNAGNGKILTSDATGNASWQKGIIDTGVGFGPWGDCSVNNISEYNPDVDPTGTADDYFGGSTSISGNFAIVGAYNDDVGVNINQGSASIFQFNGTNWVFMQKLTDATGATGDFFGSSVSISGNYAIVGSYADDVGANVDQGSASIYFYNGTTWVLMQKITDSNGAGGDFFGTSVSISGNYAIAGSFSDDVGAIADQGSLSIFFYNGTSWSNVQKLTDAGGATGDYFGVSCAVNGNYLVVGESGDDVGVNSNQGSVLMYRYNNVSWVLTQKTTDAGNNANTNYGSSVSISGAYLIVGAYTDGFGGNSNYGSATIYQYNGSNWVLMQKLIKTNQTNFDYFGNSVSISGNYALVGAPGSSLGTTTQEGSATLYMRLGTGWKKLQYITDPGGNPVDLLGTSCGVDGVSMRFIIGATGYGNKSGTVLFGKIN